MRTLVVTGAASGIGMATVERVRRDGARTIGVDLHDADVIADLGSATGRAAMLDAVAALAPDGIDGVVAAAGISALDRPEAVLSINYFGAVATLNGLVGLLAKKPRPRAVVIGSTAALLPSDERTVAACLAGDETEARAHILKRPATAYASSKLAVSRWLRRAAISPEWAGSGILLNGIAPGVVETAMTLPLLQDDSMLALIAQSNPMAVQGFAQPEEIAELINYLLTFDGHYLLGQMIFCDGGTDAILRPEGF